MQCLNRRRRYLNSGGKPFWYNYTSIQNSNYTYIHRMGLGGVSLGDAAVFAGGGTYSYTPNAYSNQYACNYADYISKNLISSSLTNLNTARWSVGSAVLDIYDSPTPAQNFDCEFISINLSSLPSGGYAYATIDNSSTQYTSGSITVSTSSTVHIYMNRKSGNAGVYLYRNKGEPIVDPNSMAGGDTSMPDYHQWGSSLTYDWTPSSAPMSFTSATITFENENSGYLNCTILIESDSSSEDDTPVVTGKRVFFIGGSTVSSSSENATNVVDIYAFAGGTHTTSSLTSNRTYFGCTTLDNKIFIAGGRNTIVGNNDSSDYYNRDLIIYNNLFTKVSESSSALSEKKYKLASVSSEDYAMFAGGTLFSNFQYRNPSTTIDVFNKNGQKVTISPTISLTNVNLANYGPSAMYFKQNFLIVTANGTNMFNKNLIATSAPVTPNRDVCCTCVLGNYALIGGGIALSEGTVYSSTNVFCYNGRMILNSLTSPITYGKYSGVAVTVDKKYALFAGADAQAQSVDIFTLKKKSDVYIRIIPQGYTSTSEGHYGAYVCKETGTRSYSYTATQFTIDSLVFNAEKWESNYLESGYHYFRYNSTDGHWYKMPNSSTSNFSNGIKINNLVDIGITLECSGLSTRAVLRISVSVSMSNTKYINSIKLDDTTGIYHIYAKSGTATDSSDTSYTTPVGAYLNGVECFKQSTSSTSYTDICGFSLRDKPNTFITVKLVNGTAYAYNTSPYYVYINTYPTNNPYKETT